LGSSSYRAKVYNLAEAIKGILANNTADFLLTEISK
jgi:hypothetical protein